jgi:hypothetical protein
MMLTPLWYQKCVILNDACFSHYRAQEGMGAFHMVNVATKETKKEGSTRRQTS